MKAKILTKLFFGESNSFINNYSFGVYATTFCHVTLCDPENRTKKFGLVLDFAYGVPRFKWLGNPNSHVRVNHWLQIRQVRLAMMGTEGFDRRIGFKRHGNATVG